MPTLDRENLEQEFNISNDDTEPLEPEIVDDNNDDPFELEWENETSNSETLKTNIDRANEILDIIQDEMTNGNFSARLVEVAGQIINSVTNASKVLIDNTNYNRYLDIRKKLALLKEKEVKIKQLKIDRPKNQNLIIATREDVLKIIHDKKNAEQDSETNFNSEQ